MAKITAETKAEGGLVVLKNGQPTGVLIDRAQQLVRALNPTPTKEDITSKLLKAQAMCFQYGLTNVGDAGLSPDIIDHIDSLQKAGTLKIRLYPMVSVSQENIEKMLKKGIYVSDRLNVRSFQIYADGALGSRGACLLKPYSDAPETTGFLLFSPTELEKWISQLANSEFQANTPVSYTHLDVYKRQTTPSCLGVNNLS